MRLSVTALSYDGVLSVSLLADEALDNFAAMAAGVQSGFDAYQSRADATHGRGEISFSRNDRHNTRSVT